LSEVGRTTSAIDDAPTPNAATAEVAARGSDRVKAVRPSVDGSDDEQEVTTLVPARPSPAAPPRPLYDARQSWPVMAVALILSVTAGLIAGFYLLGARQSVETWQRPAPPSTTTESAAIPAAPVVTALESDAKTEKVNEDESVPKPAPPVTDTDSRRAPEAEPPARRVVVTEARLERPTQTSRRSADRSPAKKLTQRDTAAAPPRVKPVQERSSTSAPTKRSLPVSSPPPSAKSKKVIQWP